MSKPRIVIVKSPSGAKTHRMDVRYAVLGYALCGASVSRERVPRRNDGGADCKKCRIAAGENA